MLFPLFAYGVSIMLHWLNKTKTIFFFLCSNVCTKKRRFGVFGFNFDIISIIMSDDGWSFDMVGSKFDMFSVMRIVTGNEIDFQFEEIRQQRNTVKAISLKITNLLINFFTRNQSTTNIFGKF